MNVQPIASVAGGPPLRILWTLPYLPWPTTSGGKLRHSTCCARSARGHRITVLAQSRTHLAPIAAANWKAWSSG